MVVAGDSACPLCGDPASDQPGGACPGCGADLGDPAAQQLREAVAEVALSQAAYDAARVRLDRDLAARERARVELGATRFRMLRLGPEDDAPREDAPVAPPAVSAPRDVFAVPGPYRPRAPRAPRARTARLRTALTAPVLLGMAGAALLIASAIVFVAVTWETILPALQAVILLAIAAAVGVLARWVLRRGMSEPAGAIGVVSAAFAGTAVVALERTADVLGVFTTPVALLVAAATASLLARRDVPWLSLAAAATVPVAALIAVAGAGAESGAAGLALSAAVAVGLLMAAGERWFDGMGARIQRYAVAALGPLAVVATYALADLDPGEIGWVWAPAIAAVGAAVRWRGIGVASAVAAATGAGAAMAPLLDEPALALLVIAAIGALALAAGASEPALQRAVAWGLVPAGIAAVVAAIAGLGIAIDARGAAATAPWAWPLGLVGIGAASIVARRWDDAEHARAVLMAGAASVAAATVPVVLAVAPPSGGGAAIALAATLVAVVLAGAARTWPAGPARLTVALAGVATGAGGALVGVAAWASPGERWPWLALAGAAVPVALALAAVRGAPRALGSLTALLVTLAPAATVLRLGGGEAWAGAALVASAAALAWLLAGVAPERARWALAGLAPAVVLLVVALAWGGAAAIDVLRIEGAAGSRGWLLACGLTLLAGVVASAAIRGRAIGDGDPARLGEAAGAVLAVATAGVGTAAVASAGVGEVATMGAALVLSAAAGATGWWWRDAKARAVAQIGAIAWVTALALRGVAGIAVGLVPPVTGATVVLGIAGLLALAALLVPRFATSPAVAIATLVAPAWVSGADGGPVAVALAAAASAAGAAWLLRALGEHRAVAGRWGLVPVALWALPGFASAVLAWLGAVSDAWEGSGAGTPVDPLAAPAAAVAAVGLLAARRLRADAATIVAGACVLAAAAVPTPWSAIVVAAVAVAGVAVLGRWTVGPWHPVLLALAAVLMAGVHPWAQVAAHAVVASVLVLIARRMVAWREVGGLVAVAAGAIAARLAVGELGAEVVATAALAGVAFAGIVALARLGWLPSDAVARAGGAASILVLAAGIVADDATATGLAMLVVSAGWLALREPAPLPARVGAAIAATLGVGLVLGGAGVEALEAYTIVPAAWALAEGVAWMRRDPELASTTALGGGLALAIVPSLVAIAVQPGALVRTVGLTLAVAALAVVSVRTRWLAPAVAAAATAVALALVQVAVPDPELPRWIAFAAVGAVLLGLAVAYDRLRQLR